MDFKLTRTDRFPVGTSVAAYPASARREGAAPVGSAVDTQTMAADGLTFTGLQPQTAYVAYAKVGDEHRYVAFRTERPQESFTDERIPSPGSGDAGKVLAVNEAEDGYELVAGGGGSGVGEWQPIQYTDGWRAAPETGRLWARQEPGGIVRLQGGAFGGDAISNNVGSLAGLDGEGWIPPTLLGFPTRSYLDMSPVIVFIHGMVDGDGHPSPMPGLIRAVEVMPDKLKYYSERVNHFLHNPGELEWFTLSDLDLSASDDDGQLGNLTGNTGLTYSFPPRDEVLFNFTFATTPFPQS